MSQVLAIHLDESGTPLRGVDDDGVFVVGGVATVGDPEKIGLLWKAHRTGRKGAALTDEELLDLTEFLSSQGLVPIASHVHLVSEDWAWAERKVRALHELATHGEPRLSPAGYLWALQVIQTAVTAAMASLPFVFGEIARVQIFVDKYEQKGWFKELLTKQVPRWFEAGGRFRQLLTELDQRTGGDPDIQTLRASVKTSSGTSSIDWNSRGPLHEMADAVAALYRRRLKGERGAAAAWGVLEARYARDGRPPACMGLDLTKTVRESIRGLPQVKWMGGHEDP